MTKTPVYYYVFDIIYFDGYDLKLVPLIERKSLLKHNIVFNDKICFTKHYNKYGIKFHDYVCKKGLEGIIAKDALSSYKNQRSRDWLKFKCSNQQEFIIIGYTEPKGKRIGVGALLLGYYENEKLIYAGKVGTGFNSEMLSHLKKMLAPLETKNINIYTDEKFIHWVSPQLVCEVGFTEWTNDKRLRHPRFLGLRNDKDPQEIIREME